MKKKILFTVLGMLWVIIVASVVYVVLSRDAGPENVAYDDDGLPYFNDTVVAYAIDDISEERRQELAGMIGGTPVVDDIYLADTLCVQVEATDLDHLKQYAAILMDEEDIIYAGYDYPVSFAPSTDNNTWNKTKNKKESDLGKIDHPLGNDWWAEAVDAYYVWNNLEDEITDPVNIGIIDNGFNTNHEELAGKIEILFNNTPEDHGTECSGLIVANNNDVGIRGIADKSKLYACDYTETSANDCCALMRHLIIQKDVKVINCSFGHHYYTNALEYYNNDVFDFVLSKLTAETEFEAYRGSLPAENMRSAFNVLTMMYVLQRCGYEDYIIVQSAGNGENNSGPGVDTNLNGDACSITEDIYNLWLSDYPQFEDLGYDFYDDRIIIASSAANERDNDYYVMDYDANYGENVDLCAPGDEIFTTSGKKKKNKYSKVGGTSLAAPIVTGAAAVVWSLNPDLSAGEVKEILKETATDEVKDVETDWTYPMVNVGAAAKEAYERTGKTVNEITSTDKTSQEDVLRQKKTSEEEASGDVPKQFKEKIVETTESEEASESDDSSAFKKYLRDVLVPKYGVISTETLQANEPGWDASEVNAMLSATIQDYDDDGYDEMLVVLFFTSDTGETNLELQMYEYAADTDTITLCADNRFLVPGYHSGPNAVMGFHQAGVFSYKSDNHTRIAVDTSFIANESISTLAVFSYIGVNSAYTQPGAQKPEYGTGTPTQFSYVGGAGFQQQGSGLWVVLEGTPSWEGRRSVEPEQPLFCASWTSEWTQLLKYDPDENAYALISDNQAQEFMNTYIEKVKELGLNVNDVRLSEKDDSSTFLTDEYKTNHTVTTGIYTAVQGEIDWISGIYTYEMNSGQGPYILQREDNQGTLDEFR